MSQRARAARSVSKVAKVGNWQKFETNEGSEVIFETTAGSEDQVVLLIRTGFNEQCLDGLDPDLFGKLTELSQNGKIHNNLSWKIGKSPYWKVESLKLAKRTQIPKRRKIAKLQTK